MPLYSQNPLGTEFIFCERKGRECFCNLFLVVVIVVCIFLLFIAQHSDRSVLEDFSGVCGTTVIVFVLPN